MKLLIKEKLSNHTSFKIGGIVDCMVVPNSIEELRLLICHLREKKIKTYILGKGTNLLVSDKGVRGCVVKIGENLSDILVSGPLIDAKAGALISDVAKKARDNGLTGFEALSGIPGSIGGGVNMNAGAYESEIQDKLVSVDVIDENGKIKTLKKNQLDFSYRHSNIEKNGYIITHARFRLANEDIKVIDEKMQKFKMLRENKQPLEYPSAGSVFKRLEGKYASQLIKDSMLQGEMIGGAQISTKHAGFIVNKKNATAQDVYKLMQYIIEQIKTYYNIELEPEIKLWGKF